LKYILTMEGCMATIQSKVCRGHRYWYIVQSRRVNGKPRPIVLAYLGKPEDLLRRLQGLGGQVHLKSYSHGLVSALLQIASQLNVADIINKYIESPRRYTSQKPIRNNLTAGVSIMLAAIGKICMPTSKRGWGIWARTTSLEYLLRCSLGKLDSQHFWDMMDVVPVDAIDRIEQELLEKVFDLYRLGSDTLFFDTTNFFTFIATGNQRCGIAQRGKNKQKRNDLRQVGLAMVVTREDMVPVFHLSYKGNLHDAVVFRQVLTRIKQRLADLSLDMEKHTLVFDKGIVSKANLALIKGLSLHYLGALSPYHHKKLVAEATDNFEQVLINDRPMQVFRDKRTIWFAKRTVVVFISENLKAGQLHGIYQSLDKKINKLKKLQQSLERSSAKRRNWTKLQETVKEIVKGQFTNELIDWSVIQESNGRFRFEFDVDQEKLNKLEDRLGFRILVTDRDDWGTAEIIKAYHGQSQIEHTFKNLKNPYHLALRPQFHWTDQKIIVNNFICVLGYLLACLVWRQAKSKACFIGTLDTLLDTLNNVRLATILEQSGKCGPAKATYQLEQMSQQQQHLMQALGIEEFHLQRRRLNGVSVYNAK
jgi:transposase